MFVTLIPKVENLTPLKDYSPISLCNFPYKLIGKILVGPNLRISCQNCSLKNMGLWSLEEIY